MQRAAYRVHEAMGDGTDDAPHLGWTEDDPSWIDTAASTDGESLRAAAPAPRAAFAQAALLLLAPGGTGTRTVVLGDNASALSAAAGYLGSEGLEVGGGPAALDELETGSADAIILNGALKRFVPLEDPAAADELFEQCTRVLKPGGRILLTLDNPFSMKNVREALRSGPSGVAHLAHWHRRCLDALRRRCHVTDVYLLWPGVDSWRELRPQASGLPGITDHSLRGHLEQVVLAGARMMRVESALAPGHLLLAQRRGDPVPQPVLSQRLQQAEGLPPGPVLISARANSRSATFTTGDLFFKVPLSPIGAAALRAEVSNLAEISGRPIARFAPLPARLSRHDGVRYATFPAMPPCDRAPRDSDMVDFICALHGDPMPIPLSQTALWSRVFAEDMRQMLCRLGASPVLDYLQQNDGARRVLAGPIHGDLHWGNVMARGQGKHLVDWDRYEACSPVLLDYAEAFLSCTGDFYGGGRAVPLEALLAAIGTADSFLCAQLTRACGELTAAEAVTVYVLHRASWMLRRHGLSDGPELSRVRDQVAFCSRQLALRG